MTLAAAGAMCGPAAAQFVDLQPDLLPAEQAFVLSANLQGGQLQFSVTIADGYYLYRDRIFLRTISGPPAGELQLPAGQVITDEFFGEIATFRDAVSFTAPVAARQGDLLVEVVTQGCADIGVCYPPQTAQLAFAGGGGGGQLVAFSSGPGALDTAPADNTSSLRSVLADASLLLTVLAFFNAGLLLSFTPCVLPMVPIAMAIATKGARVGGARALALGGTYVLGMAVVYTALGVIVAGSGGVVLAGLLQTAALQIALGSLFALLGVLAWRKAGVSLLPSAVRNWLAGYQGRPGTLPTAAAAGAISAVVVSPCVAAPLVGALLYIASTGDTATGASALFALALGMGALPLACCAGAASLLPRTGPLSEALRKIFALLLVALGLWIAGPAVPAAIKLIGYGLLGLTGSAVLILAALQTKAASRVIAGCGAAGLAVLGAVMLVGGATGGNNELAPLAHLGRQVQGELQFVPVSSIAQYEASAAQLPPRATLEYYYADWCVSCKEIEAAVFNDDDVITAVAKLKLLKIDLSANDADARSLLFRSELFGPPAVIVRDAAGRQIARLVGNFDKLLLLDSLARIS